MTDSPAVFLTRRDRRELTPRPTRWIVDRFLAAGKFTVLYGKSFSGKSLYMSAACDAVTAGESFAGMECERGSVLVIDAENGKFEARERDEKLGALDRADVDVEESFYVDAMDAGWDLFRSEDDQRRAEDFVMRHRPAIVLFDSLGSCWHGAKLRDDADMRKVATWLVDLARRSSAAVVVLHHSTKYGQDYKDSQVIAQMADAMFRLERDDKRGTVTLVEEGMRATESVPKRRCFVREGQDRYTYRPADGNNDDSTDGRQQTGKRATAAEEVARVLRARRDLFPFGALRFKGTKATLKERADLPTTDRTLGAALELLKATGDVEQDPTGTWQLVDKSQTGERGTGPSDGSKPVRPAEAVGSVAPAAEAGSTASEVEPSAPEVVTPVEFDVDPQPAMPASGDATAEDEPPAIDRDPPPITPADEPGPVEERLIQLCSDPRGMSVGDMRWRLRTFSCPTTPDEIKAALACLQERGLAEPAEQDHHWKIHDGAQGGQRCLTR